MSAGYVYAHVTPVNSAAVAALIATHVGAGYQLVEDLQAVRFTELAAGTVPTLGLSGRAFSAQCEVRWQCLSAQGDAYSVQIMTEQPLTLGAEWPCTEFDAVVPARQVLWGKREAGMPMWREARIPRPQSYPLAGAGELAALTTLLYTTQGVTRLTRLQGIERIKEAEHG